MKKIFQAKNGVIFGLILIAAISRLFPHAPNFTAVTAMALFAGSVWGLSLAAFVVPLAAMVATDFIFGAHSTTLYVYGSLIAITAFGAVALKNRKALSILTTTLVSSMLFYVVTNFGVWLEQDLYPKTQEGLVECYVMALPFLRNQVVGDLMFSVAIFACYALLVRVFSLNSVKTNSSL
jgi:hypothetical protein